MQRDRRNARYLPDTRFPDLIEATAELGAAVSAADDVLVAAERLPLAGLDEPETRELAAAVAGSELGPSDGRRLHERTAGNPLFITETVRAIFVDGGPPNAGAEAPADGRMPDEDATVRPGMPTTLRTLLGSRIDAQAEGDRTVIRVASVVGVTFDEPVVAEVLGDDIAPDVYVRLADASLIVPVETPGGWRFSHPLIHDAAYWGLLASARRQLHTIVADRLESTDGPVPIGVVARHRAAAKDVERAVPLLLRAADEAAAVGASAEAASFWTAAADLEPAAPAADAYRQRARAALEAVPAGRSTSIAPTSIGPTPPT